MKPSINKINFISLNGKTLYCLKDLCSEFELSYKNVKTQLANSYICIKDIGSNRYQVFIDLNAVEQLMSCYKCIRLIDFYKRAVRDDFTENMRDMKNHCIFLGV